MVGRATRVGVLATRPEMLSEGTQMRIAHAEASVASHVGFSVAIGEHIAAGPAKVQARLREVGAQTRRALADVAGWQVRENIEEPSAITTLTPPDGVDAATVRADLIVDHGILTTFIGVERAPQVMTRPHCASHRTWTSPTTTWPPSSTHWRPSRGCDAGHFWLSLLRHRRDIGGTQPMTASEADEREPQEPSKPEKKRDRTHWLYIMVIVAVIAGIIVGLVAPEVAGSLGVLGSCSSS